MIPKNISPDTLVFDIETNSLNTNDGVMKFFGAYSYKYEKYFFYNLNEKEKIEALLKSHRCVVGHNIIAFDMPMMINPVNKYFKSFDYKVRVDTLLMARKKLMMMVDSNDIPIRSTRFNLDTVHKKLFPGLKSKLPFNYELLKKPFDKYTPEEIAYIKEYTDNDVRITKEVFEEFCRQFSHFKPLMDEKNQRNYKWITRNTGSYAYSVLCYKMKIEETYGSYDMNKETYTGAAVLDLKYHEIHGDCYVLDFSSQYPHNYFQFNLFTPAGSCCGKDCKKDKCPYYFTGNKLYKLAGQYCIKAMGKKEKILKELYLERMKLKNAGDSRQAALKTVLNSIYGITADPVFQQVYYPHRAADCCTLGRCQINYADYYFTSKGYKVAGGDTDSIFVLDPFSDKIKLKKELANFTRILQKYVPFPSDTFHMDIDYELTDMWLVKKKHYIFLTKDKKLVIKGLPAMKANASLLTRLVLENYIKPHAIKTRILRFKKTEIMDFIAKERKKNPMIVATTFNISDTADHYTNSSSIQAQIKEKYGTGKIILVKNRRIGVGKAVKYCSIEEASKLRSYEIDLSTTLKELAPFFYENTHTRLSDFSSLIKNNIAGEKGDGWEVVI